MNVKLSLLMIKRLVFMVVEKGINVIEDLKNKIIEFYLFNIKKLIIVALIFWGFIVGSTVYAKDTFNVELKCKGHDQEYCDIVKNSDNKTSFILRDMRYPEVDKVNETIFHAHGSCGSPCQYHFFISKTKEDQTQELIALDKNNNCLIESDSRKKLIYSRKLFSNNKKIIVNLNSEKINIPQPTFSYYSYFNEMSQFDNAGDLNLIANDYGKILFKKKIENPCGGDGK